MTWYGKVSPQAGSPDKSEGNHTLPNLLAADDKGSRLLKKDEQRFQVRADSYATMSSTFLRILVPKLVYLTRN